MIAPICLRTLPPPPVDRAEILRYARGGEDGTVAPLLDEMLALAAPRLTYRAVLREVAVETAGDTVTLGPLVAVSHSLAEALGGARHALVLASTVGAGLDRLLLRYGRLSPARALLLQAIGTERIESLLGALTPELEATYGRLTRRFSPGYGDLPLALQRELLPLLEAERRLGITLSDTMLMSPSKSVTAIVGILD